MVGFNTQPPEGGWFATRQCLNHREYVSTHSRPKAAGRRRRRPSSPCRCFNTQPPEGGWRRCDNAVGFKCSVSTHSRPKAAGILKKAGYAPCGFQHTAARRRLAEIRMSISVCAGFNTQPPEGGWLHGFAKTQFYCWFQHTAARRRLDFSN